MSQRSSFLVRLSQMCVVVTGLVVAPIASSQMQFVMGIYAYDEPNEVIWGCPPVQAALARRMGTILDRDVALEVTLDDDYDQGVMALTGGDIHVARFPNVENYWVIHPSVDLAVADAWRDAMVQLRLEEIVPTIVSEAQEQAVNLDVAELSESTLAAVEEKFGSCLQVIQRWGAASNPSGLRLLDTPPIILYGYSKALLDVLATGRMEAEIDALNELPATAAGPTDSASDDSGAAENKSGEATR